MIDWKNAKSEAPAHDGEYLTYTIRDYKPYNISRYIKGEGGWDYGMSNVDYWAEMTAPEAVFEPIDLEPIVEALGTATRCVSLLHQAQEHGSALMAWGFAQKAIDCLQSAIDGLNKCNA